MTAKRNGASIVQWLVGFGGATYILGRLAHKPVQGDLGAAAFGAIILAYLLIKSRAKGRRKTGARVAASAGEVLRAPVTVRRCKVVDGQIVEAFLTYPTNGHDYAPNQKDAMHAALAARMGGPVRIDKWDTENGIIKARRRRPATVDHGGQVARVENIAQLMFGPQAYASHDQWNGDTLQRFAINYPPTTKDASSTFRADFDHTLTSKLGQRYTSNWEPDLDRVTYSIAVALQTRIDHPAGVLPGQPVIPFASDKNGDIIAWDLKKSAHCLVGGGTGNGKSVFIRTLVTSATEHGIETRICDTKRIDLSGLRGWPGVTAVATTLDDITAMILDTAAEVDRRTEAVEAGHVHRDDLPRMLLLVDETWETLERIAEAHKQSKGTGTAPAVLAFRATIRLGRGVGVHVVAAVQRPDAKIIGGEARDNFRCRIQIGTPQSAALQRMMELDRTVTPDAGGNVPEGRAIVNVGGGEREVQIWWTPDPGDQRLGGPDRQILDRLQPRSRVATAGAPPAPSPAPTAPGLVSPARPALHLVRSEPDADPEPIQTAKKTCSTCHEEKALEEFTKDRHKPDGRSSRCLGCNRERVRATRATD